MAFVGAISDLFNCGKPRRRESALDTSNAPGAERDVIPAVELVPVNGCLGSFEAKTPAAPSDDTTPVRSADWTTTRHASAESTNRKEESKPPLSPTRSSARPDRENELDEVAQGPWGRDERPDGGAKVDHKPWVVEQRILVTSSTHDTKIAVPKDASESQLQTLSTPSNNSEPKEVDPFQPEDEEGDSPPLEAEHTAATVAIAEAKPEDPENSVSSVAAEEPVVTLVAPLEPSPSSISSKESAEAEEVIAGAVSSPKTAPKQFLDLPLEIRNAIYERLAETSPIRMCRHDDPAIARSGDKTIPSKRQYYSLTKVCRQIRQEFLPVYEKRTEYIIDLWDQKAHLGSLSTLKGQVAMDIDAACFDMAPIDLLPLIRYLARTGRTNCRFASTEGVVFRSIETIVGELNKLLPSYSSSQNWKAAVNGPMKRIDLHLFPHEDVRNYYRFRGAEPMLRIVYPSAATEAWMKQSHKSGGEYEVFLAKTGLDALDMHVVVGHASRRTTNVDRLPLDWRLSYAGSRLSLDQAVRISGTFAR